MATIDVNKPISFESSSKEVQSWIDRINAEITAFKKNIEQLQRMADSPSSLADKAQESLDVLKGGLDTFTEQAKKATEQVREREEAAFNNNSKQIELLAERLVKYVQDFNKAFDVQ